MVALIALSIRSWHACAVRFALPLRVYCVITQFPSERRPAALVLNLLAEAPRFCAQGSSWGPSYALDWLPNRSQRLHCASLTLPYLSGRSGSAIVIADRCDRAISSHWVTAPFLLQLYCTFICSYLKKKKKKKNKKTITCLVLFFLPFRRP